MSQAMSQVDSAPKLDRQREHQANERIFLAWLRTSIALMSFGFVIARFGLFLQEMGLVLVKQEPTLRSVISSQNVGVALIVLGVAATVGAAWRYEQVYGQIERGDFKPARRWVWLVTAITFVLGVLIVPFLLVDLSAPVAAPASKRIGHNEATWTWSVVKITLDWASRLNARSRLLFSAVVAAIAYWLPVPKVQPLVHTLIAWEAGVCCFLLLAWAIIVSADSDSVRRNAQGQDESATTIFVLVICAACASLFAVALLLAGSRPAQGSPLGLEVALTIFSVFESWLLVHTAFALHYAHGYYRSPDDDDTPGDGLDFPGEKRPDYLDFAYFSFVIGMTSQVSDVAVTSRSIRRLVLIHGIISFVFNTVILATSVNVVAGLLG